MQITRKIIFALLCCLLWQLQANAQEKELKLAVTGLNGLEELERNFKPFQSIISEVSGYNIKFYPLTSRTIVIQALKAGTVDLVLMGPAEYAIAASKTKVTPIAALTRPDYFSSIIALNDGEIKSLRDLKGHKVGLGEIGSTSYHLAPVEILTNYGLNPEKDLKILHLPKQVAWAALQRKEVDAIGIRNEVFLKFRAEDKTPGRYRVIGRSADLPDDLLVASDKVSANTIEKLKVTIKHNSDKLIEAILSGEENGKYKGMRFVADVKDSDYDDIRAMFAKSGYPEFSTHYQGE